VALDVAGGTKQDLQGDIRQALQITDCRASSSGRYSSSIQLPNCAESCSKRPLGADERIGFVHRGTPQLVLLQAVGYDDPRSSGTY
jgi:hypothetical protein